jgi:sialate O-acetylesterase
LVLCCNHSEMHFAAALLVTLGSSELAVPSFFASHMVLQHGAPVQLWGTGATPAATVSVVLSSSAAPPATAVAEADGRWHVTLPAAAPSLAPADIVITTSAGQPAAAADGTVTLSSVLFGETYVCSGQSNMGLTVIATANASAYIAAAGSGAAAAALRIAQVATDPSYYNVTSPQADLLLSIPWGTPSPANVAGMSAVCYYYGLEMVANHPGMPVGMIASAWGGTAVEVWMSPGALAKCGATRAATPAAAADSTAATARSNPDPGLGHLPGRAHELGACPTLHSTLWNAMIAPLLPLALSGYLWCKRYARGGSVARPT